MCGRDLDGVLSSGGSSGSVGVPGRLAQERWADECWKLNGWYAQIDGPQLCSLRNQPKVLSNKQTRRTTHRRDQYNGSAE